MAAGAERLAVALLPLAVRDGGVERLVARERLVVWSGYLASVAAEADPRVVLRRYRGRVVGFIERYVYSEVKRVLASPRRLRRAARRNMDAAVKAFRAYTPHGLGASHHEIRNRLIRILGPRLGAQLFRVLVQKLSRYVRWARRAYNRRARAAASWFYPCLRYVQEEGYTYWAAVRKCREWMRIGWDIRNEFDPAEL